MIDYSLKKKWKYKLRCDKWAVILYLYKRCECAASNLVNIWNCELRMLGTVPLMSSGVNWDGYGRRAIFLIQFTLSDDMRAGLCPLPFIARWNETLQRVGFACGAASRSLISECFHTTLARYSVAHGDYIFLDSETWSSACIGFGLMSTSAWRGRRAFTSFQLLQSILCVTTFVVKVHSPINKSTMVEKQKFNRRRNNTILRFKISSVASAPWMYVVKEVGPIANMPMFQNMYD